MRRTSAAIAMASAARRPPEKTSTASNIEDGVAQPRRANRQKRQEGGSGHQHHDSHRKRDDTRARLPLWSRQNRVAAGAHGPCTMLRRRLAVERVAEGAGDQPVDVIRYRHHRCASLSQWCGGFKRHMGVARANCSRRWTRPGARRIAAIDRQEGHPPMFTPAALPRRPHRHHARPDAPSSLLRRLSPWRMAQSLQTISRSL